MASSLSGPRHRARDPLSAQSPRRPAPNDPRSSPGSSPPKPGAVGHALRASLDASHTGRDRWALSMRHERARRRGEIRPIRRRMAMIAEVVALATRPRSPQNIGLQRSAPASFEANNNILQAAYLQGISTEAAGSDLKFVERRLSREPGGGVSKQKSRPDQLSRAMDKAVLSMRYPEHSCA